MSPTRKPTPEEIFEILEEQAAEDEAKRILALSDEELDRELADEGFDPQAERAWGRAVAERATRAAEEGSAEGAFVSVVPIAPPKATRPRWVVLLAAAIAVAVLGGGGAYVAARWIRHDEERPPPRVVPDAVPSVTSAAPLPPAAPPRAPDSKGRNPDGK